MSAFPSKPPKPDKNPDKVSGFLSGLCPVSYNAPMDDSVEAEFEVEMPCPQCGGGLVEVWTDESSVECCRCRAEFGVDRSEEGSPRIFPA